MRPAAPGLAGILLVALLAPLPGLADDFTDTIQNALDAYAEGDITVAGEELDYASSLLNDMRGQALERFLPPALPGWTRSDAAETEGAGMAMAIFGGGTTAAATYAKGGEEMTITLVANSPMVNGLGAILGGLSAAGGGKPIRIQRVQFMMNDGELQGVVDKKVMVSVAGSAALEDKTAQLDKMDFKALADF